MRYSKEQIVEAFTVGYRRGQDVVTSFAGGSPFPAKETSLEGWLPAQKEDVCKWMVTQRSNVGHWHHSTECGGKHVHRDGDYCSGCGKKIEVVK